MCKNVRGAASTSSRHNAHGKCSFCLVARESLHACCGSSAPPPKECVAALPRFLSASSICTGKSSLQDCIVEAILEVASEAETLHGFPLSGRAFRDCGGVDCCVCFGADDVPLSGNASSSFTPSVQAIMLSVCFESLGLQVYE